MSDAPAVPRARGSAVRPLVWVFHLSLPLLGLWLLVAQPGVDVRWEDHPSHFWLVVAVAAVNVVIAGRMGAEASRRSDARLFLVSQAFVVGAGFLGLHALATPEVLLGKNAGFVVATPAGLLLAGVFAAASAIEYRPETAAALMRRRRVIQASVYGVLVVWGAVSLLGLPPLDAEITLGDPYGPSGLAAAVGVALYGFAAVRYWRAYRRRPSVVLVGVITAFALLAEAMIATPFARNWQLSWWEWHLLMAAGFLFVAYAARVQWAREGSASGLFDAITLQDTMRQIREEYAEALEALVEAMREEGSGRARSLRSVAASMSERFGLTEGQTAVLVRAAEALRGERDLALENDRLYRQVDALFRQYVSPDVAAALAADPSTAALGGAEREVSVLFADLRGFTSFSERSSPQEVVELLNRYFGAATPLVLAEGGTVDKFVGDAMMALWNVRGDQPDHALRAARTALSMQRAVESLREGHDEWPRFRVGVNTGSALIGNIGSAELRNYTAIGDTVNLASRLETAAEPGQVVIGAATLERIRDVADVEPLGDLQLKGKSEPVPAFALLALDGAARR